MTNPSGSQERITAFWSTVAPGYEEHPGNVAVPGSTEYAAWVDAIGRLLGTAPADVLDIGTGTGFVARIAAGLGHRVSGIDLAEPMLAIAAAEAERSELLVSFRRDDAVSPSFPPASFDVIVSRHLLWTLRQPLVALANWRRLLRGGGRVVTIDGFWFDADTFDDDSALPELFQQHYTRETREAIPVMDFKSADQVAGLFLTAGFERVDVGYLADVHRLAEAPPSEAPWYVVTATTA